MARRILLPLVLVFALSGCKTVIVTKVDVKPNGHGFVSMRFNYDADVAATLPNLDAQLGLADMRQNGWIVVGPTKLKSGGNEISVRHAFANQTEATNLLQAIATPNRNLKVTISNGFIYSSASIKGTVDLTDGIASLVSPAKRASLDSSNADFKSFIDVKRDVVITLEIADQGHHQAVGLSMGATHSVSITAGGVNQAVWYFLAAWVFVLIAFGFGRRKIRLKGDDEPVEAQEFSVT